MNEESLNRDRGEQENVCPTYCKRQLLLNPSGELLYESASPAWDDYLFLREATSP
jgi:hypothetical protein